MGTIDRSLDKQSVDITKLTVAFRNFSNASKRSFYIAIFIY